MNGGRPFRFSKGFADAARRGSPEKRLARLRAALQGKRQGQGQHPPEQALNCSRRVPPGSPSVNHRNPFIVAWSGWTETNAFVSTDVSIRPSRTRCLDRRRAAQVTRGATMNTKRLTSPYIRPWFNSSRRMGMPPFGFEVAFDSDFGITPASFAFRDRHEKTAGTRGVCGSSGRIGFPLRGPVRSICKIVGSAGSHSHTPSGIPKEIGLSAIGSVSLSYFLRLSTAGPCFPRVFAW